MDQKFTGSPNFASQIWPGTKFYLQNLVWGPIFARTKFATTGLPISTVEQNWFHNLIKLVEPKLQNVFTVAVSLRLDDLYKVKRNLLAEIATSEVDKPTETINFWTGCNAKSYMGSTVHYIHGKKLESHVLSLLKWNLHIHQKM